MIDDGLQPWPAEVLRAVRRFRQGDVIPLPSTFYLSTPRYPLWRLSLPEAPDDVDPQIVESEWNEGALGLITSQTCDITEDGRTTPRKPWIQVAPVYDLRHAGTLPQHLVRLTGQDLPGNSIADLRIELPVEKGWLVDQNPIAGFSDAEGFRSLARRLALQREREALPQWVEDLIYKPFQNADELLGTAMLGTVEEVRLAFETNDLSTTQVVWFVVLTIEAARIEELTALWSDWCEGLSSRLPAGASLLPVVVLTADMMTAREYRVTAPIAQFSV